MEKKDIPIKQKYICVACGTVDLELGANVEFNADKKILRHRYCGGEAVADEKGSKSDYKHL